MKASDCVPYLVMVLVEILYAGATLTVKIGLANGLNQFVFVVYRHVISMVIFSSFACMFERKERPTLTFVMILKIFVLTSLGTTIHINGVSYGIMYTTATVSSALNCLTPSLTFLIAFLLRMEKVKITSSRGQAKILGTLLSIGGTLIITLWTGGFELKGLVNKPIIDIHDPKDLHGHAKHNWIKGVTLISASKVSWSLWLIFQGVVFKMYDAPLTINVMICLFATLQSSLLALFFARDASMWKLEWDVRLLAIVYGGLVISGLTYYLVLMTIKKKGPVFVAMFSALELPIVGVFSSVAFNETLHAGSLLGALLMIIGLYCVLWGKSKDNFVKLPEKETDVENGDKASNNSTNDVMLNNLSKTES